MEHTHEAPTRGNSQAPTGDAAADRLIARLTTKQAEHRAKANELGVLIRQIRRRPGIAGALADAAK